MACRFDSGCPHHFNLRFAQIKMSGIAPSLGGDDGLPDNLEKHMHYTYIIRSIQYSNEVYTGTTSDLKQRLADHNSGKVSHTSKFTPWNLECYIAFPDKQNACSFEKYLKTHSGRAFATKRLHKKNSLTDSPKGSLKPRTLKKV